MLKSLNDLKKNGIEMKSGDKRKIKDFLADDQGWQVRYIVVDEEEWLPGRTILVSTQTVKRATGDNRLPVDITAEQIKNGPLREKDKPIDREFETSLSSYYGWKPYWGTEGKTRNVISMDEVMTYQVNASDGDIGHAEDLIVDDTDWIVTYIVVDTSNWNPIAKKTLISTDWIKSLDMSTKKVELNVNKDKVKSAPEYNAGDKLNR